MSEILNRFEICSQISEELKQEIKLFHVFDDKKGFNVLFTTSDDNVFSFGSNALGCCGFGQNSPVTEPQVIPELCHKNIQQFFIGGTFILGLSSDKQLYGWGDNSKGQLGRGFVTEAEIFFKPQIIGFPYERAIQVSCGTAYSLALTSEGCVYGWGSNQNGQIGCGKRNGKQITKPLKLTMFEKFTIKYIFCSFNRSFALTTDGFVYSWGSNNWSELGHDSNETDLCLYEPKLIVLSNVVSVCPSSGNTYFLTNYGKTYFCGEFVDKNGKSYQKSPKLMSSAMNLSFLYSVPLYQKYESISVGINQDKIFNLHHHQIENLEYNTVFDYYCNEWKVCYKTLCIDNKMAFNGNDVSDLYCYENPNQFQNPFEDNYEILRELGSGGFGTVFEVKNAHNIRYAIKKIEIKDEMDEENKTSIFREVNTLSKCSDDFVVHYFDSWIENSYHYIRMELCSDNLKNIIQEKKEIFKQVHSQAMDSIEYFISCQLFQEVLECVQYLHELKPPIIHRDLKPENILVSSNPINGRFLKIGDFGCAKFTRLTTNSDNSRGEGTFKYMAPEVNKGNKYSPKADIYSLGIVAMEIFDFNISESLNSLTKPINPDLKSKYECLEKTIESMMKVKSKERPTCAQILYSNDWSIMRSEIGDFGLDYPHVFQSDDQRYFRKYFDARILLLNQSDDWSPSLFSTIYYYVQNVLSDFLNLDDF